jgi:hypothetical protein
LLCLSLGFAALAAGCRASASSAAGVDISIDINDPAAGQPTALVVHLVDSAGAPIEGAAVEVEGNMRHAGMVPVLAPAVEDSPGRYVAEGFVFSMGGDWVMTVRASLADGRKAERSIELPGVSGPRASASRPVAAARGWG